IVYNNSLTLNGFQFRTNGNTTNMVLSKDGNLGVGNNNPGKYRAKISHHLFGLDLEDLGSGNNWELAAFNSLSLYFNGSLRGSFNSTTGAYTASSDSRLKTNIKPMSSVLDKIARLKPAAFQFKNTTDTQEYNGFIAQDVMEVFPAMVTHNVNQARNLDVYSLDYSGFGVVAIKGIQELQKNVEDQKDKIAELEARLDRLEKMLKAIN
ncbi:MAG: tail fiber domain-containing protein, partial [Ginsengibacter sp.]